MARGLTILLLLSFSGCGLLPVRRTLPVVHNPFPQFTKVAIVPFFNQSAEPTVDGRQFAEAYFAELQRIPGFEVTPVGVADTAVHQYRSYLNDLQSPDDVRRLAQLLDVDAVVIGAVTDFSEYYPPRLALHVEWYAANPCFHPVPPGYGLPWGTPDEKEIPPSVVYDAEHAMARTFLKGATPKPPVHFKGSGPGADHGRASAPGDAAGPSLLQPEAVRDSDAAPPQGSGPRQIAHLSGSTTAPGDASHETLAVGIEATASAPCCDDGSAAHAAMHEPLSMPPCRASNDPVLRHTRVYHGHDGDFTALLVDYLAFRDDARTNDVRGYLQRKEDFIRFCCFLHISEMLSARGGNAETRVLWLWPGNR